jgi:hypothetical protein
VVAPLKIRNIALVNIAHIASLVPPCSTRISFQLEISVRKNNISLANVNEMSKTVSTITSIHIGWHPKGHPLNTATDFVINFLTSLYRI